MDTRPPRHLFHGFPSRIGQFWQNYLSRLKLFNRNIRLLLFGEFLVGLGMTSWGLFFNLYLEETGFSANPKSLIGATLVVANLAGAVFALPAGYLAGRYSLKLQLIIFQLASIAASALAMFAPGARSLYALIFAANATGVFARVAAGPLIMQNTTPAERTYAFSTNFIIMLVGGVAGNAFAGQIKAFLNRSGVAALLGYRWTIVGGIAFSLIGAIPFFFIRNAAPGEADVLSLRDWRKWNWPFFGKMLLPAGLIAIGAGLFNQFMNVYFKDRFRSSDEAIGIYMAAQSATMALGVMLAPALAEKFGKIRTIVAIQLLSLPFMSVLGFSENLHASVAAFIVRAALMNMASPVTSALMMELCRREEQGVVNALSILVWNVSWATSAQFFGTLKGNFKILFTIAIVLYFTASVFYFILFRKAESEKPADAPR